MKYFVLMQLPLCNILHRNFDLAIHYIYPFLINHNIVLRYVTKMVQEGLCRVLLPPKAHLHGVQEKEK